MPNKNCRFRNLVKIYFTFSHGMETHVRATDDGAPQMAFTYSK